MIRETRLKTVCKKSERQNKAMKKIMSVILKNKQLLCCAVYTVALFSLYICAAAMGGPHIVRTGILFVFLYILGVILISFIGRRLSVRRGNAKDKLALSRMLFDSVDRMDSPALMCRADGKIFWCNEALCAASGDGRKPYGKSVSELLGTSLTSIRDATPEDGLGVDFCGRYYIAKYSNVKSERGGALVLLTESSELKTMGDELDLIHEKLEEGELVLAYIFVDNLTEMIRYDNESYRPASAKINELLREWAADAHGILKEYEKDRYLFVFERKYLNRYIDKKFDILDRVRDIRVGEEQLSVTVSVGISIVYGSFEEKEKSARAAIEMALGRGGDQVAVKTNEGTEFYGGRTRSAIQRSSIRSRVVANELLMHMSRSSNVLIMGHKYPDYDSVGACIGLARIAEFCGVDVNIVIDVNDKNVALCLEYLKDVPGYGKLFVSADEGLDLMQTGTFVVLADVNSLSIVEDIEIIKAAKQFAVIDHHRKHAEYAVEPELEYIEPNASSACELVSEMLEQIIPQDKLSRGEANLLLAGILLDTKQFSRMTGTRTYGAALYLHDSGADPQAVQELFKSDLDEYLNEAKFRSNVVIYRKCMAITICENDAAGEAEDKIMASKAAEGLIGVRGIKAAFAMVTLGGTMHISARSTGRINVQLILEKLRGGGHFDTAGAQISGVGREEAVRMLKAAIDEYLDVYEKEL